MREKPEHSKTETAAKEEARIVRRIEAAERLSSSTRTLDKLAAAGVLPRRKLPGHVRSSGFLASDIEALFATRMLLPGN